MTGKIALFMLTMLLILTVLVKFTVIVNDVAVENHLYSYIGTFADRISMEGAISSADHASLKNRIQSAGDYELIIRYDRRIGPGLYEVSTDISDITDRIFAKGDIVSFVVARHNGVVFSRSAYVMVNAVEYVMGKDVIRGIGESAIPVYIRNRGQSEYDIYNTMENPFYGDDPQEQPYGSSYIFEYARYIQRDEFDGGQIIATSYTEQ